MPRPTNEELEQARAYGAMRDYLEERAMKRVRTMGVPKERESTFAMIALLQTAWDLAQKQPHTLEMFHVSHASLVGFEKMMAGAWVYAQRVGEELDFMRAVSAATGALTQVVETVPPMETNDDGAANGGPDTGSTEVGDGHDGAAEGGIG